MEKDPEDRPESAGDVLSILESPEDVQESLRESKELKVLDRIVRGRMVGRQGKFEEARQLWKETTTGSGQILFISGEPGVGKTRLSREIITHAEVSGGTALIGEAYAESNAPYGAFAQIVRSGLIRFQGNGLELPDAVLDDLLDLVSDLRYQYPNLEPNPKLEPESQQMRLLEHMVTFCDLLAKKRP
jgi:hypothetical protein